MPALLAERSFLPRSAGSPAPVRVVDQLADVGGLAEAWERLASSPAQQLLWARACSHAFGGGGRLAVVVAGAPPGPVAIAPLSRRRAGLEWLGMAELHEPMDGLYTDAAAAEALAEALALSGQPLLLRRVPAESPLVGALTRAYRGRGVIMTRPAAGSPWIPLDGGGAEPELPLNARLTCDLRRARRRAESLGAVRCEVLSPGASELGRLLDEALRVEAAGWKGRDGTAMASDPRVGSFFRRYAAGARAMGILRLCFLRIDGRAAAMQLALEWRERFWLLKIGYDEAFSRCSPGALLMLETLRHAARRGLRSYELLGSVEPWTRMWTRHVHACVSVHAYPRSVLGFANPAAAAGRRRRERSLSVQRWSPA